MRKACLGFLLGSLVLSASAADQSLDLGGVPIGLGMERAKARGDLKKFKVTCLSDSDTKNAPVCNSWFVASGGNRTFSRLAVCTSTIAVVSDWL
jgi:hypothetical protein